jgi:sterol 3beta-glucosyltransferase
MKIAITTVGTRGDLQPYIALGLGLKKAGHDVLIVSAKNEAAFVLGYGLDFYPLNVDIQQLMAGGEVKEMAQGNNPLKFVIGHLRGSKKMKALMVKTQGEIWDACKEVDMIIFHPGMPIGYFIAKEKNKLAVMACPFPVLATKAYPSILFYSFPRLGQTFNLFTHFLFDKIFWALSKPAIKEFWLSNIKSKINFSTSAIKQITKSNMPIINGYSNLLFKHAKEWGGNVATTGSWIIEDEPEFMLPAGLVEFIDNEAAPIYIGFGSLNNKDSMQATLDIVLKALEMTNQRAVIALGTDGGQFNGVLPASVFLIQNIPHTWLFPKMKMVIHHGGAGTTATGLRAGRPTVIIPHNADQPAWGQRVYELGVGSKPIKKASLTAGNLAAAIIYALQEEIISNAENLGAELRKENGVEKAVQFLAASPLLSD